MEAPRPQVTQLLSRMRAGDSVAEHELFELVFAELRGMAQAAFAHQDPGHTLQPTALVHEAWLKLAGNMEGVQDRRHFFVLAGRAMRQVLTDHARAHASQKRGGGARRVTLHSGLRNGGLDGGADEMGLLELDESLRRLELCNERHCRVVELRLFSGLSIPETAEVLRVSVRTVEGDWAMAKAWLRRELGSTG